MWDCNLIDRSVVDLVKRRSPVNQREFMDARSISLWLTASVRDGSLERESFCHCNWQLVMRWNSTPVDLYDTIISKICSWVMNLSGSSRRGVGVFSRVVIFLSKIRPPYVSSHAVSLAQFMYACSDSSIPCAYLCNNSKWCLRH